MSKIQKLLISFGVFWASLWVAAVLAQPLGKLTDRIVYRDGVLDALAMGIMSSIGRAIAAAFAGAVITFVVPNRKPESWALVIAALYLVASPVRHHWGSPATTWDRLWQGVDLLFPAVACVGAAVVSARLHRRRAANSTAVAPTS